MRQRFSRMVEMAAFERQLFSGMVDMAGFEGRSAFALPRAGLFLNPWGSCAALTSPGRGLAVGGVGVSRICGAPSSRVLQAVGVESEATEALGDEDDNMAWGKSGTSSTERVRVNTNRESTQRTRRVEKLWREFFWDPTKWRDNRSQNFVRRLPDFRHKTSSKALWIGDSARPSWVERELSAIPQGVLQFDTYGWNKKLGRSLKDGDFQKTVAVLQEMVRDGVKPDKYTFVHLLKLCTSLRVLEEGKRVHLQIKEAGHDSDTFVCSSLIDMYARCGEIGEALSVFHKMPSNSVVSWNAMIAGYVKYGQAEKSFEIFRQMQENGVEPDPYTFVSLLNACTSLRTLDRGKRIHEQIIEKNLMSHVLVGNSLIDMYAKCGSLRGAEKVFHEMPERDVLSWNTMIRGCMTSGNCAKALDVFTLMRKKRVRPDAVTIMAVLNACGSLGSLEEGRRVHHYIVRKNYESSVFLASCLIDMYSKCGSLGDAQEVFDNMPARDVVAWNSMIAGCVKCGEGQRALQLFRRIQEQGELDPDSGTFVACLSACASLAALEEGRHFHKNIIDAGLGSDVYVGNSLMDMYAKCGSVEDAERVFKKMPTKDIVSWNTLLAAYAMHGYGNEVLQHFGKLSEEIEKVNDATLVSLLTGCSHAGLVAEGLHYFESMSTDYKVSPTVEHFACVVDLLARAGRLHEAEDFVITMPCEPSSAVLISLLGGCRIHGNVGMAEGIAYDIVGMEPQKASGYVVLHGIYATAGMWKNCAILQNRKLFMGVRSQPGRTSIEVNKEMHSFVLDDSEHPRIKEIRAELKSLSERLREAGYEQNGNFSLHDVDEERKAAQLPHHSEKLAIAFGLISTSPGTPLCIYKNMRVCGDCHTTIKFISKVVGRVITVREVNRFHHVEDGICSCRDYW